MAALLAAIIQPMRLKARSQFADAAKIEKMKTAVLTRNGGKLSRTSGSFQKHLGSASYFFFNVYQLFLVKIDFDVILPFRHFGFKKRFRHSEIDCDQKKWVLFSTALCGEKKVFFSTSKKRKSFFFSNFDFFRKKTCTKTFRRAFFENSFKIRLFTCLQKIRILPGRKKRPAPRKTLQDSGPKKTSCKC